MLEFNIFSYDNIDNNKKGNFSLGWVKFNDGTFEGRETLIKAVPGKDQDKSSLIYPNKENFEIPYIALNSLVSELICKIGDPEGETAEYFLANQKEYGLLICSPSFQESGEELFEGNNLITIGNRNKKRYKPRDALALVEDISEILRRLGVPSEDIEKIKKQYIKDCFKNLYLGIYDSNNNNFGVLIQNSKHARIAPIYDLDLGLNVPFEYKDNVDPEFKINHEEYLKTTSSPDYLGKYISTITKHVSPRTHKREFLWFEDWVEEFMQNTKHIDLKKQLYEEKGLDIPDEQIKHYTDFINTRNEQLQKYLYETRFENLLEL